MVRDVWLGKVLFQVKESQSGNLLTITFQKFCKTVYSVRPDEDLFLALTVYDLWLYESTMV